MIDRKLGPYKISEEIGSGGMASFDRGDMLQVIEYFNPVLRGDLTEAEVEEARAAGAALELAAVFDEIAARPLPRSTSAGT